MKSRRTRRIVGLIAVVTAILASLPVLSANAADRSIASAARGICYSPITDAHGRGRQACNGRIGGSTDPARERVEGWGFLSTGAGLMCVSLHLRGFGWTTEQCGDGRVFDVGEFGSGLEVNGMQWRSAQGVLCFRIRLTFQDGSSAWQTVECSANGAPNIFEREAGRITALSGNYDA